MVAPRALVALLALAACRDLEPATGESSETTGAPGEASATATTGDVPPPFDPGPAVVMRLTRAQYFNSIRDLLGPNLPVLPLEPDQDPHFFHSIGAATTTLSELGAEQYEQSANALASHVFTDHDNRLGLVGCTPQTTDDPCAAAFLASFARRAYRRPLTADESAVWSTVAAELADGDPWRGLQFAVAGLLQSPHFLYRVERGEPEPGDPARRRLTNHELAARLAFLLWNAGPDDALLHAAQSPHFSDPDNLRTTAERLLADPRARVALHDFFSQVLDLDRLDTVTRDPARFPRYSPDLPAAMRREVELQLEDIILRRDVDLRTLLSTRQSFHNSALASLYGTHPGGADPITYVPVQLPAERAGLLSLAAFLTLTSHPAETSPTRRGKYLRERLLCQSIAPPPPGVDTSLDPAPGNKPTTVRERLEAHRRDPACAGCHAAMDPPGLLFEHFDAIGVYRDLGDGQPIDASGDLDGTPLTTIPDLADLLASDPRVAPCVVTLLHRHASGRLAAPGELPALQMLTDNFIGEDHRFRALLLAFVTSDAFIYISTTEVAP